MKHYIKSFILLFSSLLILFSCSPKTNNESQDLLFTKLSYHVDEIDVSKLGLSYINEIVYCKNIDRLLLNGKCVNGDNLLVNTSSDFKDIDDIEFNGNENIICIDNNANNEIAIISSSESESDAIFFLYIFDKEFKIKKRTNIVIPYDNFKIYDAFLNEDNSVLIFINCYETNQNVVLHFDLSNDEIDNIKELSNVEWIESIGKTPDGKLILSYQTNDVPMLGVFLMNDFQFESTQKNSKYKEICDIINGFEEYKYFINSGDGIDGINQNGEKNLFDWADIGLNGENIESVISIDNDEFIAIESNRENKSLYAYHVFSDKKNKFDEEKYVTLGTAFVTQELSSLVAEYNRYSTNYKVKIVDYGIYDDERLDIPEMGAASQLNHDIISGKTPDMIDISGFSNAEVLKKKGCFIDLYEYFEKDDKIKKEDFLQNILTINEFNGKLEVIPFCFYVNTLVGKEKYVGTKENWSLNDLIYYYNNAPKEMQFMINSDRESIIDTLLYGNISNYVNYEKKQCNFDSEDFINLLEFAEKSTIDIEGSESRYNQNYEFGMINNKFLVCEADLHNFNDFHSLYKGKFKNEDITFVGYPSFNCSGAIFSSSNSFSVFNASEKKDECWNFIKYFLSEERQLEFNDFPINKNALNRIADKTCVPPKDETTGEVIKENFIRMGDEQVDIGYMTENEKSRYINYISNMDRSLVYDIQVYLICKEEISMFLVGEITAQQTAINIQNRVYLYINE